MAIYIHFWKYNNEIMSFEHKVATSYEDAIYQYNEDHVPPTAPKNIVRPVYQYTLICHDNGIWSKMDMQDELEQERLQELQERDDIERYGTYESQNKLSTNQVL